MDCTTATIGLFILGMSGLLTGGVALVLGVLPHIQARKRRLERARYLRAHLLTHLDLLRSCLTPRDRPMTTEQEHVVDDLWPLTVQLDQLEFDEWQAVLRAQSALATARHKSSYNKREARVAERLLDDALAVLRSHLSAASGTRSSWRHRWRLASLSAREACAIPTRTSQRERSFPKGGGKTAVDSRQEYEPAHRITVTRANEQGSEAR